jgi:glycosyltransferase involved in cell wall biosynthesis
MKEKLVTIMTPCYNGEKYIKNLIESILKQTYSNIEFILIDDGSTDNTEKVVKGYETKLKDKNITLKYIKQKNQGQATAANNGLKQVEGEFLIWPDADDYFEKDAIQNMTDFLNKNREYNAVRGKVAFRKDNLEKEVIEIKGSSNADNTDLFLNYILEEDTYCFAGGTMLIRTKNFFEKNKGRDIYLNKAGQNWQIILPAVYQSKTGYIDKIVYHYVVRENSHSRTKQSKLDVLKRMQNHRKILNKTVSKIVDNKEEKKKYLKIIKDKYDVRQKEYIKYQLKHWNEK